MVILHFIMLMTAYWMVMRSGGGDESLFFLYIPNGVVRVLPLQQTVPGFAVLLWDNPSDPSS